MAQVTQAPKGATPAAAPKGATPAAAPVATPATAPVAQGVLALAAMAQAPGAAPVLATVAQAAHLQALPRHLAAKVASAVTGGTQSKVPRKLVGVVLAMGKPHGAKAPAEIAWANYLQAAVTAKPQGCAALLAGQPAGMGLGGHTVQAYYGRGWLVAHKG